MNLSQIQQMVYDRLGFNSPDATAIARFLSYINETQREILGSKGFSRLRRDPAMAFASVSGTPYAVLPQAATRVRSIRDPLNRRLMGPVTFDDINYMDPGLAFSSSVPYAWTLISLAAAVAAQPSAAAELFVKSTAAGDGATKTAFIEGITTGGYYRTASVVMNGVTAVSFGATITDWIEVTKFYIALGAGGTTTAAGVVTLNQTSGAGAELSRISIGRAFARYTKIQFYPTPAAVVNYTADVDIHIQDMTQATDEPYVPEDFHDLLVIGALMKEYTRREKPVQYASELAKWKLRKSELRVHVGAISGENRRAEETMSFSQLGPNFPAGS